MIKIIYGRRVNRKSLKKLNSNAKNTISEGAKWMLTEREINKIKISSQSYRRRLKRQRRRASRKFLRAFLGINAEQVSQFIDANSKRQIRLRKKLKE